MNVKDIGEPVLTPLTEFTSILILGAFQKLPVIEKKLDTK